MDENEILKTYADAGKKLSIYAADISREVSLLLKKGKKVIFEGAQGTFLDIDFGTYPYVTSSHPIAAGAFTGAGIGPLQVERITGIVKAYTTRVGGGLLPTELSGQAADEIRKKGNEFGTVTGRPRRVGWLDIPMLKASCRLNGFTDLAMTKIDVLSGLKEISVCTEYKSSGKTIDEFPSCPEMLEGTEPLYKKFKGFSISGNERKFSELDINAREYIEFIERQLGVKFLIISVGQERDQTILRNP